jgi:hypothetical protein
MWLLAFELALLSVAPAFPQVPEIRVESDAGRLARIVRDPLTDEQAKQDAALSLGCLGGDQAVRFLDGSLQDASPTLRPRIARALGHTRSRLAVPVLIGMFRDDSARDDVCDALMTLTHRAWCDGGDDDVALRRAWRRWWSQMKSRVEIYGSDSCGQTREQESRGQPNVW